MMKKYLSEYDLSYIHVDERFSVDPKNHYTVEDYLYGRCHLFAQALHENKGLEVGVFAAMADLPFKDEPCLVLVHAFCFISDEDVIDAKGIRSKNDLFARYDNGEGVFELSGQEAHAALAEMKLFPFDEGERKALDRYIRKMEHHGMLVPGVLDEHQAESSPRI